MTVGCCAQRILNPRSLGLSSVYKMGAGMHMHSPHSINMYIESCAVYKQYSTRSNYVTTVFNQRSSNFQKLLNYRHLFTASKLLAYPRLSPQEVNLPEQKIQVSQAQA